MKQEYIVNGKAVDELEVIQTESGYIINYKKKFNILDAKSREINLRLIKNDIKCYNIRYDKEKIIILYNFEMNNIHKIIDVLKLYQNQYEIDYEQEMIIIDIP